MFKSLNQIELVNLILFQILQGSECQFKSVYVS